MISGGSYLQDGLFSVHSTTCQNKVVYSRLRRFERVEKSAPTISLKYVMHGVEHYTLNRKTFSVKEGQFLLVNQGQQSETLLQSVDPIHGLCFFIETKTLGDIYHNHVSDCNHLLDNPVSSNAIAFDIYEDIYPAMQTSLGNILRETSKRLMGSEGNLEIIGEDIYSTVAEGILQSQNIVQKKINRINATRLATRKELYKRIMLAKGLIDDSCTDRINVPHIARAASLSEFHFIRTFKQVIGLSPHQYILKRRLERATNLLRSNNYSVIETANICGFSDVHAFSKCFKKNFNVAPSMFTKTH